MMSGNTVKELRRNAMIWLLAVVVSFLAQGGMADSCIENPANAIRTMCSSGSATLTGGFVSGYDWVFDFSRGTMNGMFKSSKVGTVVSFR